MKTMTYPHYTVAPSVETIFVDGFRFDICEFKGEQAQKEFGVSKRSRFFLMMKTNVLILRFLHPVVKGLVMKFGPCIVVINNI